VLQHFAFGSRFSDNSNPGAIYPQACGSYRGNASVPISVNEPDTDFSSNVLGTRAAAERLGVAYARTYRKQFVVARIFNTFGPHQRKYVMFDLLNKMHLTRHSIDVLGDGSQLREYSFVTDTARARATYRVWSRISADWEVWAMSRKYRWRTASIFS
jgi:nucleoside-diphosphate-sugar epimerase